MSGMILRGNRQNRLKFSPVPAARRYPLRNVQNQSKKIIKKASETIRKKKVFAKSKESKEVKAAEKVEEEKVAPVIPVEEEEIKFTLGLKITSPKGYTYTVEGKLGEGTFGVVLLVRSCYGPFAMKVLYNTTEEDRSNNHIEDNIWRYITSVTSITDPLLRLQESFDFGQYKCFVMEKMECDLLKIMDEEGVLEIERIRKIAEQLLTALAHLNKLKLVHCDLKPENIMFVDTSEESGEPEKIKLIDFGCSMRRREVVETPGMAIQTPKYRAPEVLLGLPMDEKVDIFSAGLIFFEMFTGRELYTARTDAVQLKEIATVVGLPSNYDKGKHYSKYMAYQESSGFDEFLDEEDVIPSVEDMKNLDKTLEMGYSVSSTGDFTRADHHFLSLLRLLLKSDPRERISAEEALKHRFFQSDN